MKILKTGILYLSLTIGIICAQRTLIYAGAMIDGESKKMKTRLTIVVDDGIIVDVANGYLNASPGEIVFDLKNATVTPGWMDLHVHFGLLWASSVQMGLHGSIQGHVGWPRMELP